MGRLKYALRSCVAYAVLLGIGSIPGVTYGADVLPVKAPQQAGCAQAVDGINGKVSTLGGSFANNGVYGGMGSLGLPLGCELGAQIDGTAASFDKRFLGSIAGHIFWRDPAKALVGLYGSYTYWNSNVGGVNSNHIGPEGEVYMGRWTLQGLGGVEFGNSVSGSVGPIIQTYDIKTRFFDEVNLAYYLEDNFKVYAGHRYLAGRNALAIGGEYGIPMSHGVMASLFLEGRVGEDSFNGVWGGLRFYFGQKDKTLIRRQREDDPIVWDDFGITNHGSTAPGSPPPCSGDGCG